MTSLYLGIIISYHINVFLEMSPKLHYKGLYHFVPFVALYFCKILNIASKERAFVLLNAFKKIYQFNKAVGLRVLCKY